MATNKKQNRINITNEERAEQGRQAVEEYAGTKEECLIDLLTNLRHFASEEQINFDRAVITSGFHYREETV
jgi:predicted MarR family transcription regulator